VPERSNIDPAITAAARRPRERLIPNPKARLREQFREVCRFRHLSERTEEAYWGWVRRFLVWARDQGSTESRPTGLATGGAWRHPRDLGGFIFGGHPGVIPPATFRPASGLRSGALCLRKSNLWIRSAKLRARKSIFRGRSAALCGRKTVFRGRNSPLCGRKSVLWGRSAAWCGRKSALCLHSAALCLHKRLLWRRSVVLFRQGRVGRDVFCQKVRTGQDSGGQDFRKSWIVWRGRSSEYCGRRL
jgi:hypothetical protein